MGTDALREAFRTVVRADFLRPNNRAMADVDAPVPIGNGQTNSQPRTVVAMLELLDVHPGQRILDVGSGSGWTTALLAELVGDAGTVIGVEIDPSLVAFGSANLRAYDYPWAAIRQAEPDVLGAPDQAPFDRVLVSAEARELPQPLVDQLAVDGILLLPVRSRMTRVVKSSVDDITLTTHGTYSFVPLLWP